MKLTTPICVVCKSPEIILQLYKSLVRPHLEYCLQVWKAHLRKDVRLLERFSMIWCEWSRLQAHAVWE